ncbi:MAG: M20/M25/M40 family metallo-hydrolase [Phycisphaerales bacterium]|nr:M20/M25/M40 family metallo-hydrolase [Phycisphaerales bacterium]
MNQGLSERELAVCRAIKRRELALLDDLRLHVELPTGGRNRVALDETRDRLTARAAVLGASVELHAGVPGPRWLFGQSADQSDPLPIAVCRRDTGQMPAVLIAGHLDTVHDPAGSFRELRIDSTETRATGPGCVDMKGGLVIALAALEALEECGVHIDWTLLLNSDEETGSFESATTITEEARCMASRPRGTLGIALEPASADGGLVVERAGSGQFVLEITGVAAHVGRDFASGISAVHRLARAILQCAELSDPASGKIVNIGPIEGGSATNVVPDRARAWGNLRFADTQQCTAMVASIQLIAQEHGGACSFAVGRPAKPVTPDVEKFARAVRSVSESLGMPLPFARTGGVCDGNLMQAAGLTTLDTLGVKGGGLHTTSEWIDLSTLVPRCQLLALTIMRQAGGQILG